jgi:hypothetical protein
MRLHLQRSREWALEMTDYLAAGTPLSDEDNKG